MTMAKYFFDVGAHKGESARLFRQKYDPWCRFLIISFEPNISLNVEIQKGHVVIRQALWTHDGPVQFFAARTSDGSTMMQNKITGGVNYDVPLVVEAYDAKHLFRNVTEDDFVIMKMNIEGGEYEILPYMIENKLEKLVDVLLIQWHDRKLDDLQVKQHHEVLYKEVHDRFRHVVDLQGAYKDYGDLDQWIPKV